ncbi:DUF4158 domain-containing protein [Rhizobium calliandrae]|uniref:DUF4158 domain-containing protein n=1 Tax=Rhizobium calliandrae TaxID=1312182 RepID=A0ABT7KM12_9HYPH|nr:DUF4158 domain-containing protein [Rhizobium calliandrae]MDL2409612.1 DUF4158 domain-containing protein [Rhizobium calliandrae]
MRKRELLSEAEREQLLGIPIERDDLARLYTLEPRDIDQLRLRREDRNRLGVALQLALFRHPGMTLAQILQRSAGLPKELVSFIALQLDVRAAALADYATAPLAERLRSLNIKDFQLFPSVACGGAERAWKSHEVRNKHCVTGAQVEPKASVSD